MSGYVGMEQPAMQMIGYLSTMPPSFVEVYADLIADRTL